MSADTGRNPTAWNSALAQGLARVPKTFDEESGGRHLPGPYPQGGCTKVEVAVSYRCHVCTVAATQAKFSKVETLEKPLAIAAELLLAAVYSRTENESHDENCFTLDYCLTARASWRCPRQLSALRAVSWRVRQSLFSLFTLEADTFTSVLTPPGALPARGVGKGSVPQAHYSGGLTVPPCTAGVSWCPFVRPAGRPRRPRFVCPHTSDLHALRSLCKRVQNVQSYCR